MKSTLVSRLKHLEHLETLRRNVASVPIGAQPDVTAAISEYLERLGEWCRSMASGQPGNWEDLPPNPIGSPVKLSIAEFRKMIADVEETQTKASQDDRATA